jgi:hypothetical protein
MEILRVSGTPAELREAGILDLVAQTMGNQDQGQPDVDDADINQLITRARNEYRPFVAAFVRGVLAWEGCHVGTIIPRYARIEVGRNTLVYVVPSRPTADIYFDWDEDTVVQYGEKIEAQGWTPKLVQVRLESDQGVEEALEFARQSYEAQRAA